jgi:L-alanine-DL-glutamate epimerase-like enolase superfamily enzyme
MWVGGFVLTVAPHNYYSHLADLHAVHLCAVLPNVRIMEIDIDDVPWKKELVTNPPLIQDGCIALPTRPGWGADINEEVLAAHPFELNRNNSTEQTPLPRATV